MGKSPDLQGTLELHMQFYYRISRSDRTRNENCHAHYSSACTQYGYNHIHVSGEIFKRLGHMRSPCWCCNCSPFTCRVCTCRIIHLCVPCMYIHPLCSLWVVTDCSLIYPLLLGEYTSFTHATLYCRTTRLHS